MLNAHLHGGNCLQLIQIIHANSETSKESDHDRTQNFPRMRGDIFFTLSLTTALKLESVVPYIMACDFVAYLGIATFGGVGQAGSN